MTAPSMNCVMVLVAASGLSKKAPDVTMGQFAVPGWATVN